MSALPQERTSNRQIGLDRLQAALRRLLPTGALLVSGEEKRPYECDGLSAYRQLPGLVALPETIEHAESWGHHT